MVSAKQRIFALFVSVGFAGLWSPLNAEELTIVASERACRLLVSHIPDNDVSFKPGVDARGNPVAPAELPNDQSILSKVPTVYEFPISVNPLPNSTVNRFSETKLDLGRIRFDRNTGEASYNGQPIRGVGRRELVLECRKILGE